MQTLAKSITFHWMYSGEGAKPFEDDHMFSTNWYSEDGMNMVGCALPDHPIVEAAGDSLFEGLIDKNSDEIVQYLRGDEEGVSVEQAIEAIVKPRMNDYMLVCYIVDHNGGVMPDNINNAMF